MIGESPTRPGYLYAHPLVLTAEATSPRRSRARKFTVPRSSLTVFRTTGSSLARRRTLAGVSPALRSRSIQSLRVEAGRVPARFPPISRAKRAAPPPRGKTCGGRSLARRATVAVPHHAAAALPAVRPLPHGAEVIQRPFVARRLFPLALVWKAIDPAGPDREPPAIGDRVGPGHALDCAVGLGTLCTPIDRRGGLGPVGKCRVFAHGHGMARDGKNSYVFRPPRIT